MRSSNLDAKLNSGTNGKAAFSLWNLRKALRVVMSSNGVGDQPNLHSVLMGCVQTTSGSSINV